jgi:CheY-like chemotaxis protein
MGRAGRGGHGDHAMSVAERNNVRLAGGGNRPMVFAHGFGCDQNMWRYMAPAFESTHRIVLFDHVGAGHSDASSYDRQKYGTLDGYALLAHELRNPLAPLRAGVEIFRRSDNKSTLLSKTTAIMERQVAQIGRLVEDLLDISRIGQEKLSLRRVPVDLRSVVQHAIEMSEPLLQNAGLSFAVSPWPTPIHVSADAPRLAQAIGNILNNAAKFTPHGGTVSLLLEREGGDALIRVRDTGIGIDPAEQPRIFDLFVQAETSLERPEGLGIGLSLAKSLVERHDGRLIVHSDGRGHGAEFIIRLGVLSEVPERVSPSFVAIGRRPHASPKRILVVDDNEDAAQMMALLLGVGGHDVRVAHDGFAAVALSAEIQPHVVLLDIGLPG